MEKEMDDLDEALIEEVCKIKLFLGGNPDENFIFCEGEEEGLAFHFKGTPNEIRAYAIETDTFVLCIQPPELMQDDDTPVNWFIGGIGMTKQILNIYFTSEAKIGNEFSTLDTKTKNTLLVFAIQVAVDVDLNLELKYDSSEDKPSNSVGLCLYPEVADKLPISLN